MSSPTPTITPPKAGNPLIPEAEIHHYTTRQIVFMVIQLLGVLFLFLVSLNLMSEGFKLLGKGTASQLIAEASNPFIGLFVGLLATAIIQSSSTTTTMIVAMVASGALPIVSAVPMIMGANIGTSVTSTIVSLGHISNRNEYRKAISAASVHDFFNLITVVILFTVEVSTHALSGLSIWLAQGISPQEGEKVGSIIFFVKDTAKWIVSATGKNALICLPLGLAMLFLTLQMLSRLLKKLVIGRVQQSLDRYIFGHPVKSLLAGFATTTAVQSSSVTTSLMVPLVATDKVTLEKVFPFLMGANVGTTTTALIAALFMPGDLASAALAVAFAHLIFNLVGVFLLFPIRRLRAIPTRLAEGLGVLSMKNRLIGIAYVVVTFFIIPFSLIFFFSN